jgi:nucleotide-binding universal stress UspA family protein
VQDSGRSTETTIPIRKIVLATDFLESSRLALDYAVAFSHHYGADLTIVHAFELPREAEEAEFISHRPSLSRERALARLEAFATGVRRFGVHAETNLREGEPCSAVLSAAAENKADLLVLGTHGIFRGLHHILVGSNAEKILLSACCPTLTVGRHVLAGIDLELRFKEIFCVTEFSPESIAAVCYAAALGRDLGIRTVLLPTIPDNMPDGVDDIHRMVDRFCSELAAREELPCREWCDPVYHMDRMVSAESIVRRAEGCADGLFVVGVHKESRLNRHLHTSFAYELVARAGCPLLSVHDPARSDQSSGTE